MSFIKRPEPADSEVIIPAAGDAPAFTWGDHRQMEKMLAELEESDPAVMAAKVKLDRALEQVGWEQKKNEFICQYCWRTEEQGHDHDCRDYDDPALHVRREAGGYQYLDENFVIIHTTSVPMTDDEALGYFSTVDTFLMDATPKYITRRELDGHEYKMMPWWYEPVSNEVIEIARPA